MTSLKDVNFGLNQYCGPAVLSALTGESTDRCVAVISAISGKTEIKAVAREHLKEALKRLRFEVKDESDYFGGSTLYGKLYNMCTRNGLYIVFVPHHVIAVEVKGSEIYICDNHTKAPLDIKQSARLTQKVEEVWKVTPKATPKFVRSEIKIVRNTNGLDIQSYSHYENLEDNIRYNLGHIKFKDNQELRQIIEALKNEL